MAIGVEATATVAGAPQRNRGLAPSGIVGGIGGICFLLSVIVQNILTAIDAPGNGAAASTVVRYYTDHHTTTLILAALYPVGAVGLALFLGALLSRLSASAVRAPAIAGALGATGIIAMFTMTVATEVALAQYVHRGRPDSSVVTGMWITHNAVFGVLLVSIGIALAGLSAAASTANLVPAAWKGIGLLGGVALAVAGACSPGLVNGSHVLAVGLVGFVAWALFVAFAVAGLLRDHQRDQ